MNLLIGRRSEPTKGSLHSAGDETNTARSMICAISKKKKILTNTRLNAMATESIAKPPNEA